MKLFCAVRHRLSPMYNVLFISCFLHPGWQVTLEQDYINAPGFQEAISGFVDLVAVSSSVRFVALSSATAPLVYVRAPGWNCDYRSMCFPQEDQYPEINAISFDDQHLESIRLGSTGTKVARHFTFHSRDFVVKSTAHIQPFRGPTPISLFLCRSPLYQLGSSVRASISLP